MWPCHQFCSSFCLFFRGVALLIAGLTLPLKKAASSGYICFFVFSQTVLLFLAQTGPEETGVSLGWSRCNDRLWNCKFYLLGQSPLSGLVHCCHLYNLVFIWSQNSLEDYYYFFLDLAWRLCCCCRSALQPWTSANTHLFNKSGVISHGHVACESMFLFYFDFSSWSCLDCIDIQHLWSLCPLFSGQEYQAIRCRGIMIMPWRTIDVMAFQNWEKNLSAFLFPSHAP